MSVNIIPRLSVHVQISHFSMVVCMALPLSDIWLNAWKAYIGGCGLFLVSCTGFNLLPMGLHVFSFVVFVVVFSEMCSKKKFNWKCEAIVSSFSQCLLLHGKCFHINVEMLFMTEGLYYIMWACSLHMVSHTIVTISHINFTNLKFSRQLMKLTNGSSPSRIIPCSSSKVFTFTSTPRS